MVGISLIVRRVADPAAFIAETFLHLHPKLASINELHFALTMFLFAIGEHPDIGGNASVVEQLLRQGDDGLQPVILDDPAADFAFPAASIAGEERRAVEDYSDAAAAVLRARIFASMCWRKRSAPSFTRGVPAPKRPLNPRVSRSCSI